MSGHFGAKNDKTSNDRRAVSFLSKLKKRQNEKKIISFRMAISDFQNFEFCPQNLQIYFFGKNLHKIKNFQKLQKTEYMLETFLHTTTMQSLKFLSPFLTFL